MSSRKSVGFMRPVGLVLCSLLILLVAQVSSAAGRVEWKSKTLKEADNKSWRVEVTIFLPKAPDVPTLPMKFEFQPSVYYERSMMDGDKLVERKVPLEHRQALIESVDVGFLDPGTGKTEKRTKFSFKVTRAHGYEAGEYDITIRDARNGSVVGAPARLIFNGENEIIDRRAMVFTGKEKKKKDEDVQKVGADGKVKDEKPEGEGSGSSESGSENSSGSESTESAAASSPAEDPDLGTSDSPEEVEKKSGGCGCRVHDTPRSSGAFGLVSAAFALAVFSRKRRRHFCRPSSAT